MRQAGNSAGGARQKGARERDIANFTRQLATMLKAGLPLLSALETMSRAQNPAPVTRMLADIRRKIMDGNSLFDALESSPVQFDLLYLHLVHTGEQAGTLDTILERLARQMERVLTLKKRLKSMLYYPSLIILVSLVMIAIVFPGLLFPVILSLTVLIGGTWGLFKAWKASRNFRVWADRLLLNIPVFGKLVRDSAIARWSRTLSTSYASGIPLNDAMRLLNGTTGNHVYDQACQHVQLALERGDTLLQAAQSARVFPEMVLQTLSTGESTGKLDSILNKLAEYYEEEVDVRVATVISLFPALVSIVMGILLGFLIISFYSGRLAAIGAILGL
jgi:type IV pilus assembly protein PilC